MVISPVAEMVCCGAPTGAAPMYASVLIPDTCTFRAGLTDVPPALPADAVEVSFAFCFAETVTSLKLPASRVVAPVASSTVFLIASIFVSSWMAAMTSAPVTATRIPAPTPVDLACVSLLLLASASVQQTRQVL